MKTIFGFFLITVLMQCQDSQAQENSKKGVTIEDKIQMQERFNQHLYEEIVDSKLMNKDGNIINIKSIDQKVVLLYFWATWCAPCLAENPRQKTIFDRLKKNGITDFAWINISVDEDTTLWKNTIDQEDKPGINLIGERKFIQNTFNIEHYPTYILLDVDKRIIGFDIAHTDWGPILEYLIIQAMNGSTSSAAIEKMLDFKSGYGKSTSEFIDWAKDYFGPNNEFGI